jgi:hypothetical protein
VTNATHYYDDADFLAGRWPLALIPAGPCSRVFVLMAAALLFAFLAQPAPPPVSCWRPRLGPALPENAPEMLKIT